MKAEIAAKLKEYLQVAFNDVTISVDEIFVDVDKIIAEDGPVTATEPVQPSAGPTAPTQPHTTPTGHLPAWVRFVQLKTLDGLSLEAIHSNVSAVHKDVTREQVEKVHKFVKSGRSIAHNDHLSDLFQ